MELATIINFFIILFIFAIIPGPAAFAVLSTSTRYSLIASILLAAGITVGDLVYTSAVLFSFSLFEEILTPIFVYIRIVGAIYIAYLGLSLILKKPTKFKDQKVKKNLWVQFGLGFFLCLSNPKPMVFYFLVFPQFIDLSNVTLKSSLIIMVVITATVFLTLAMFGILGQIIKKFLLKEKSLKLFNRISGVMFIIVAYYLLKS